MYEKGARAGLWASDSEPVGARASRRHLEQVERLIEALRRDEDVRRRDDAHGDACADARVEDDEAAHSARREAGDNDNEDDAAEGSVGARASAA